MDRPAYYLILVMALTLFLSSGRSAERKSALEEGQFNIYVAGKEIGQEKFTIQNFTDSVRSNSTLSFRDPGNTHRSVRIETQLNMDDHYLPRTYQLRSDVNGQKGAITGKFVPGQAEFEYQGSGNPRKSGLLVGDHYIILDTNVFHHFIFIARLFDFSAEKSQSLEVVIPQELDYGILKMSQIGVEKILIRGKKRTLHHLRADSGALVIDLWIDDQRILYKIALPSKGIEVIRNS
jgi:hypothetical protein